MSLSALSKETALEPSSLTSMIDRLEASGLVRRAALPGDRRVAVIELGETGRALEAEYAAASELMDAIFYKGLGKAEIAAFESILRRILANLVEAEKGSG